MRARICICDDDPVVSGLVGASLSAAGFDVQEPLCGVEQAMGWLSVDAPDVLLLDLNMPAGGGLDLLGWLRSQGLLERMQVLMLTSEHDLWFIDRARQLGAQGYLTKPVDGTALVAKVRRLLGDRRIAWIDDYTTLTLPERAAASSDRSVVLARLNPVIGDLARAYGEDTAARLLRSLLGQLRRIDDVVRGAADPADTAHAIKGAAASLGFKAISEACTDLEAACRTGQVIDLPLHRATEVCARVSLEISDCLQAAA